jgi:SPX domain protein involved in polyphosphate accumulation
VNDTYDLIKKQNGKSKEHEMNELKFIENMDAGISKLTSECKSCINNIIERDNK